MTRLFPLLLFLFLFINNAAAASRAKDVTEGNALYLDGDYEGSIAKYQQALGKSPESDIVNFDIGTAYYKQEDYSKAVSHLQKALLSEDNELRGKGHYNIGNAYYKSGAVWEKDDIDSALVSWEQSLAHFENAVKINDKDADAEYNYEFVKEEIARLKKKKEQQEQEQSTKKTEDREEKSEEAQESQEGQQEQQGQEGQEGQEKQQEQQQAQGNQEELSQAQEMPQGAMSPQEAQMLLENYQQNEEPKGLLNFMKRKGKEIPVLKDW